MGGVTLAKLREGLLTDSRSQTGVSAGIHGTVVVHHNNTMGSGKHMFNCENQKNKRYS